MFDACPEALGTIFKFYNGCQNVLHCGNMYKKIVISM